MITLQLIYHSNLAHVTIIMFGTVDGFVAGTLLTSEPDTEFSHLCCWLSGDSEVQRTMLELLNQLDGFEPKQNIKVRKECCDELSYTYLNPVL